MSGDSEYRNPRCRPVQQPSHRSILRCASALALQLQPHALAKASGILQFFGTENSHLLRDDLCLDTWQAVPEAR